MCACTSSLHAQTFNYRDSDFMAEAGMRVHESPIEIHGEVITPPPIKYAPAPGSRKANLVVSNLSTSKQYRAC